MKFLLLCIMGVWNIPFQMGQTTKLQEALSIWISHDWCQSDYTSLGLFKKCYRKSKENGVPSKEAQFSGEKEKKEREKEKRT